MSPSTRHTPGPIFLRGSTPHPIRAPHHLYPLLYPYPDPPKGTQRSPSSRARSSGPDSMSPTCARVGSRTPNQGHRDACHHINMTWLHYIISCMIYTCLSLHRITGGRAMHANDCSTTHRAVADDDTSNKILFLISYWYLFSTKIFYYFRRIKKKRETRRMQKRS